MPNPTQEVLWLRNRALDSTQVSVAIADARRQDVPLINVNLAFVRLTGYAQEEAIGRNCRFLQGPRTLRTVAQTLGDAIRHEQEHRAVILNYRKDGRPFWNEVNISPVYDTAGVLTHYVATQMDVTERVRNDQYRQLLNDIEAEISENLDLESVMQPVAELVVREVADACVVHLKSADDSIWRVASATSTSLKDLPDLRSLLESEPLADLVRDPVRETIGSGSRSSTIYHLERDSDSPHIGVITAPIVGNSHVFGTISMAVDERVRTLEASDNEKVKDICRRIGGMFEMGRLYSDLHTAIDVRDEFLSIAAHELRTPISSIKGYSQLLLRGLERGTLLPERLRLGLRTIETSATRLATLTSDLLEVSRVGMNRLPLHLEAISAFEYLTRFLEERQSLKSDRHEFVLLSGDPGVTFNVDVGRLDQVMSNLSSNAVKYSPPDKPVELELATESSGVAIRMRDFGIGLEEGDAERIFQPFQRSNAAVASNVPGMGLGLFISRNIVERHGGSLSATSEGPGCGTTFRIWLPNDPKSSSET